MSQLSIQAAHPLRMASTRNINTPGNYALEQRQYQQNQRYNLYAHSQWGLAYSTNLCGRGLLPGQLPRDAQSQNPIDIESFLRGTNLTNLVNPSDCLVPKLKTLESVDIYKAPSGVLMPLPLVIERNRPFPCP
jgi:hypothetical protein